MIGKKRGKEEGSEWLGRTKSFWGGEFVHRASVVQLAQHPNSRGGCAIAG